MLRGLEAHLTAAEAQGQIIGVTGELIVDGALDNTQLASLHEAAEGCRISRAMKVPVTVPIRRAPASTSPL